MRAGRLKQGTAAAVVVGVAAVVLLAAGFLVARSKSGDDAAPGPAGRSTAHSAARSAPDSASDAPRSSGQGVPTAASQIALVRETAAGAGGRITLDTERCPTEAPFVGHARPPATVSVEAPAGGDPYLTAYAASGGTMLPAPAEWECAASEGDDGSQSIEAGPAGSVTVSKSVGFPEVRGHGPAVRARLIPGCGGCIAETICSFFPHSTVVTGYESLQRCAAEPDGERRYRLSRSEFLYVDPPGVRGTAEGSGGSLSALGVLSFTPYTGVRQLSCMIGRSELDRCAAVAVAFLGLAGKS